MTPLEVDYALKDLFERNVAKAEAQTRISYEAARYIAMNVWNSQGRFLKQEIKQPTELARFPWDGVGISKKQNMEEMKAIMQNIADDINSHYERIEKRKKKNA